MAFQGNAMMRLPCTAQTGIRLLKIKLINLHF
jgi:hypothetical protein